MFLWWLCEGPLRGWLRMFFKAPPATVDSKSSLCGTTSNLFPVFFCQWTEKTARRAQSMNKFNNFSKENHLGPSLEGNKNTLKSAQGVLQNNASTARQKKKKNKSRTCEAPRLKRVGVARQSRQVDRTLTGNEVKTQGSEDRQLVQID